MTTPYARASSGLPPGATTHTIESSKEVASCPQAAPGSRAARMITTAISLILFMFGLLYRPGQMGVAQGKEQVGGVGNQGDHQEGRHRPARGHAQPL